MEVNRELPNLADGLDDSVHLLTPGGRVLVLAYHSLEDRLVKQQLRRVGRHRAARPGTSRAACPCRQGPAPLRAAPHAPPAAAERGRARGEPARGQRAPARRGAALVMKSANASASARARARHRRSASSRVSATSRSSTRPRASASGAPRLGVRLAVASVVAAVLIVVGFHVMMAEGQLQLDRLEQATAKEQQRYEALRLKYAEQIAPEAIIDRAEDLGMIQATSTALPQLRPASRPRPRSPPARMRRRAASPGIGRR